MHSLIFPFFIVMLMFSTQVFSSLENWNLNFLGVRPRTIDGLRGILLSPFIHSGWKHLFSNITAFMVLSVAFFYFYREIAYKVFGMIYFMSGILLWCGGREAWHIGASGLIYGLASFLFISGVIRKHIPLMAVSLIVVFLYGSLFWGMLPLSYEMEHSWEGHLWGFVAGFINALMFRHEGPQRPPEPFVDDEDENESGVVAEEEERE